MYMCIHYCFVIWWGWVSTTIWNCVSLEPTSGCSYRPWEQPLWEYQSKNPSHKVLGQYHSGSVWRTLLCYKFPQTVNQTCQWQQCLPVQREVDMYDCTITHMQFLQWSLLVHDDSNIVCGYLGTSRKFVLVLTGLFNHSILWYSSWYMYKTVQTHICNSTKCNYKYANCEARVSLTCC